MELMHQVDELGEQVTDLRDHRFELLDRRSERRRRRVKELLELVQCVLELLIEVRGIRHNTRPYGLDGLTGFRRLNRLHLPEQIRELRDEWRQAGREVLDERDSVRDA